MRELLLLFAYMRSIFYFPERRSSHTINDINFSLWFVLIRRLKGTWFSLTNSLWQSSPYFFSPTCPKVKLRKKFLFIQTNSFIIFTCPNPVWLVQASGMWVSIKTKYYDILQCWECELHLIFFYLTGLNTCFDFT